MLTTILVGAMEDANFTLVYTEHGLISIELSLIVVSMLSRRRTSLQNARYVKRIRTV